MTLRPRDRIALVAVLFLVLGGVYYLLALKPEQHKLTGLDSAIAAQRQLLAQEQQQFAAGRAAQASLGKSAAEWASIGLAVPAKANIPALLRILERSANAEHVKMQSIDLASSSSGTTPSSTTAPSTTAAGGASSTPIQLTFAGGYMPLRALVQRIDRFVVISGGKVHATGPLLSIGSVQLSGTRNLEANLNATIYQLPQSSPGPDAAGTGALQ